LLDRPDVRVLTFRRVLYDHWNPYERRQKHFAQTRLGLMAYGIVLDAVRD